MWISMPMCRVCERMSCEKSKNTVYISRFPSYISRYFTKRRQGFYTKILKILTWLIKAMINSGKNGYLRRIISDQIPNFWPINNNENEKGQLPVLEEILINLKSRFSPLNVEIQREGNTKISIIDFQDIRDVNFNAYV